ncbi:unnamed protein product [Rhizopus stolonifer]
MRRPIYPDSEAFINFKKEEKYAKLQQETSGSLKRKDTTEEKKEKSVAKRNRTVASSSTSTLICKSCGTSGHSSTRSKLCPNHNFILQELIEQDIGNKYERYMISLPTKPFLNETDDNNQLEKAVDKIKRLSGFFTHCDVQGSNLYQLLHYKIPSKSSQRIFFSKTSGTRCVEWFVDSYLSTIFNQSIRIFTTWKTCGQNLTVSRI